VVAATVAVGATCSRPGCLQIPSRECCVVSAATSWSGPTALLPADFKLTDKGYLSSIAATEWPKVQLVAPWFITFLAGSSECRVVSDVTGWSGPTARWPAGFELNGKEYLSATAATKWSRAPWFVTFLADYGRAGNSICHAGLCHPLLCCSPSESSSRQLLQWFAGFLGSNCFATEIGSCICLSQPL
jgi:hypothetical protein